MPRPDTWGRMWREWSHLSTSTEYEIVKMDFIIYSEVQGFLLQHVFFDKLLTTPPVTSTMVLNVKCQRQPPSGLSCPNYFLSAFVYQWRARNPVEHCLALKGKHTLLNSSHSHFAPYFVAWFLVLYNYAGNCMSSLCESKGTLVVVKRFSHCLSSG